MMDDLLGPLRGPETLAPGAIFLPGVAISRQERMMVEIRQIIASAPLRRLSTPGGRRFSVEMTNCGNLGWLSDASGYRYESRDPVTGALWPSIPGGWITFAEEMAARAGYAAFRPQACLINRYAAGARMGLHQDRDETALNNPIVSVSLGVGAYFLFGGAKRDTPVRKLRLLSGDVVVWGGRSRLFYHGVAPLPADEHPLTGVYRWNLTFRRVTVPDRP
ncbi:DNA oxidative demethylase AlkB [Asaia prunellae]|uniref:DNA oxidative demethylase AlkB n=1 Tax=Asaia prunellae TaxID=610245 RepID=UPI00046F972C|nr:DNA oxidative demethylase AlkB [Asaia prunellae]